MRFRLLTILTAVLLPATLLPAPALASGTGLPEPASVPGRILVGLVPQTDSTPSPLLGDLARKVGASQRRVLAVEDVVSLEVAPAEVDDAVRTLAADPRVAWAAPDVVMRADLTPNDPYWAQQWGPAKIGLPNAWDTGLGSRDVVIAVLDTGLDAALPEFAGRVQAGYDFVNSDADPADDHGHGTSATSVAAAGTHDATGVAGACGGCAIMPVKVLGADGSGAVSTVAAGISWAVAHGADVINLSLGAASTHPLLDQAVAEAQAAGVVLVASAGNSGTTDANYPAALPGVVAVVGTDASDARFGWSTWGDWTDVAAPGCNHTVRLQGDYGSFCGTSSAAPLVAGVVGLALSSGASAAAAVEALYSTAYPIADVTTHGRVDAAAMTAMLARENSAPEQGTSPQPPASTPEGGSEPGGAVTPGITRLAGSSRYETAVAAALDAFPSGADVAYVATGGAFPDALAAGPAAAMAGGPVLLTDTAVLPPVIREELVRLDPQRIVVAGGAAGVSEAVLAALREIAPVRRLAGPDRYATATAIAADAFEGPVPVVYLASGEAFADALAGGPAAAARRGPLLLVRPDALPAATAEALSRLQPAEVVLLGGTAAVSDAVAEQVTSLTTAPLRRIFGPDRAATAAAVAVDTHADGATLVYLATGSTFPDALAGGAAAGHVGAPLLLAAPSGLPAATAAALERLAPDRLVVLGGEQALPATVVEAALSVLQGAGAVR